LIYSTLFILTNKEKKLLKLIDKKIEVILMMQDSFEKQLLFDQKLKKNEKMLLFFLWTFLLLLFLLSNCVRIVVVVNSTSVIIVVINKRWCSFNSITALLLPPFDSAKQAYKPKSDFSRSFIYNVVCKRSPCICCCWRNRVDWLDILLSSIRRQYNDVSNGAVAEQRKCVDLPIVLWISVDWARIDGVTRI